MKALRRMGVEVHIEIGGSKYWGKVSNKGYRRDRRRVGRKVEKVEKG